MFFSESRNKFSVCVAGFSAEAITRVRPHSVNVVLGVGFYLTLAVTKYAICGLSTRYLTTSLVRSFGILSS